MMYELRTNFSKGVLCLVNDIDSLLVRLQFYSPANRTRREGLKMAVSDLMLRVWPCNSKRH